VAVIGDVPVGVSHEFVHPEAGNTATPRVAFSFFAEELDGKTDPRAANEKALWLLLVLLWLLLL